MTLFTNILRLSHSKSVDATENRQLGRLVNDDEHPNCYLRRAVVDGLQSLCLFAARAIKVNEEIRFDYGICNNTPWRTEDSEDVSCMSKILSVIDLLLKMSLNKIRSEYKYIHLQQHEKYSNFRGTNFQISKFQANVSAARKLPVGFDFRY
jgi:hypothetical protein